ncbi:hypothetical protein QBC37DRAFT_245950, partial [Rhypophila decipiens]
HLPDGSSVVASLRTVSRIWGEDKVHYYRWAERGESYCNKLCAAAREVGIWEEAVVKLNRLIHRRAQQLRRRDVKISVNPIEPDDLINLRAWSHQGPYVRKGDDEGIALHFSMLAATDLPAGFGFDKFGLLIRTEEQQPGSVMEGDLVAEGNVRELDQQTRGPRKRQSSPNNNQSR